MLNILAFVCLFLGYHIFTVIFIVNLWKGIVFVQVYKINSTPISFTMKSHDQNSTSSSLTCILNIGSEIYDFCLFVFVLENSWETEWKFNNQLGTWHLGKKCNKDYMYAFNVLKKKNKDQKNETCFFNFFIISICFCLI